MLANNVMAAEITNGNDQGLIGLTLYRSKRMPMVCLLKTKGTLSVPFVLCE